MTRIYNILANDVEAVTPFLVRRMIGNTRNGAKISFLTRRKMIFSFLRAPFSNRDVVGRHLKG
jgi:hypothetical protein